jgi:death-on-curing protein
VIEPEWLTANLVLAIHDEQLREFGGPAGIRDMGALESALGRARNRWAYEGGDLPRLAAAYGFGIARNHPFVDGNKRTGFLVGILFLELNGYRFTATEEDAAQAIVKLAAGVLDESHYSGFLRDNVTRRKK